MISITLACCQQDPNHPPTIIPPPSCPLRGRLSTQAHLQHQQGRIFVIENFKTWLFIILSISCPIDLKKGKSFMIKILLSNWLQSKQFKSSQFLSHIYCIIYLLFSLNHIYIIIIFFILIVYLISRNISVKTNFLSKYLNN